MCGSEPEVQGPRQCRVHLLSNPHGTIYVVQNARFDDGTINCTHYKPGTYYYAHSLSFDVAERGPTWSQCIICFVVKIKAWLSGTPNKIVYPLE